MVGRMDGWMNGGKSVSPWQPRANDPTPRKEGEDGWKEWWWCIGRREERRKEHKKERYKQEKDTFFG